MTWEELMCVDRLGKDHKSSVSHQGSEDQEKATTTTEQEVMVDIGV